MKKGISIWAFSDRDPNACFALAKACGYDGVEVGLGEAGPVTYNATKAEIDALRRLGESYGLSFYSLVCDDCWAYSLTSNDPDKRRRGEEMILRQLELASWLGCDTILVLPGMLECDDEVVPYDVAYDRALEALKRLAPYAEKYGVCIGVENVWNKMLLSPLEMRDFIDKIGSPWVGAYFDVGNVVVNGYPEHWIRILGSRIKKVHFKDYVRSDGTLQGFVDIGEGDVDYPAVMAALAEAGYDDWVTAEVSAPDGDVEALLKRNLTAMDNIFNAQQ